MVANLGEVAFRILRATFYEMHLYFLEFESFFEKINYKINVDSVLAGIDICGEETTFRERVNTDMTLRDDEKATPSSWVFEVIIGRSNHSRLSFTERLHFKKAANFTERRNYKLFIIKKFWTAAVAVYSNVLAEMHTDEPLSV